MASYRTGLCLVQRGFTFWKDPSAWHRFGSPKLIQKSFPGLAFSVHAHQGQQPCNGLL